MPTRPTPTLRPASAADDDAIAKLLALCFPTKGRNPKAGRPDALAWQYRDNPFAPSLSYVLEDVDGSLVAHYTAFAMPCLVNGVEGIAGNGVDAAVAPGNQGRNLFAPVASTVHDAARDAGWAVTYCFVATPIALRAATTSGWLVSAQLRMFVFAAGDRWMARRTHLPRPAAAMARKALFHIGSGPSGEIVAAPPEGLDGLWSAYRKVTDLNHGVIRDARWWDWRYAQSPLGPYRYIEHRRHGVLTGAAVVVARADDESSLAEIVEFLAVDTDAARALLRAATHAFDDTAGVVTVAHPASAQMKQLSAAGLRALPRRFEPRSTWFGFVDHTGANGHLTGADWAVFRGDQDHV